jgi:hypothetical protein
MNPDEPAFRSRQLWRRRYFDFADIDAFRSSVRSLNVEFSPLVRAISAEQIILNLPGCDVNYTKSFPRIIDAQLAPNCTAIGFIKVAQSLSLLRTVSKFDKLDCCQLFPGVICI